MKNKLVKEESNKKYFLILIGIGLIIGIYFLFQFLSGFDFSVDNFRVDNIVEFFTSKTNSFIFMVSIVCVTFGIIFMLKQLGIYKKIDKINSEDEDDEEWGDDDE